MSDQQAANRGVRQRAGRPRNSAADQAILRATIDLLAEGGLQAATIQAVAQRAGVARATIYLRWPGRDALITAAIRHAIGRAPFALTSDLRTDIARGAEQARAILQEPSFAAIAPTLLRELLSSGQAAAIVTFDRLFPNRRLVAEEFRRLAPDQGLRADLDPYGVVDLVIGPLFMRLIATGEPPSRDFTDQVVEVILSGLRAPQAGE